jgi:hypothetical protein
MTLVNKQKLTEWVKEARRMAASATGEGGNEGVIALMAKLPFRFLHEVTLPEQLTALSPGVPLVFMMTTQGIGLGLETSRRVGPGGDLDGVPVFIDGSHTVVDWLKVTLSTYDHLEMVMKECCKAYVQTESKQSLGAVLAKWKALCQMGNEGEENNREEIKGFEVAPEIFMLDAAAGPIAAVEDAFAYLTLQGRERVLMCRFHLGKCERLAAHHFLDPKLHGLHRDMIALLFNSTRDSDFEERKLTVMQ